MKWNGDKILTLLYVLGGFLLLLEITLISDFNEEIQNIFLIVLVTCLVFILFLELRKKWMKR
jgi:positive regulator of sigma E activity